MNIKGITGIIRRDTASMKLQIESNGVEFVVELEGPVKSKLELERRLNTRTDSDEVVLDTLNFETEPGLENYWGITEGIECKVSIIKRPYRSVMAQLKKDPQRVLDAAQREAAETQADLGVLHELIDKAKTAVFHATGESCS